jgi:hypothetical protein
VEHVHSVLHLFVVVTTTFRQQGVMRLVSRLASAAGSIPARLTVEMATVRQNLIV